MGVKCLGTQVLTYRFIQEEVLFSNCMFVLLSKIDAAMIKRAHRSAADNIPS